VVSQPSDLKRADTQTIGSPPITHSLPKQGIGNQKKDSREERRIQASRSFAAESDVEVENPIALREKSGKKTITPIRLICDYTARDFVMLNHSEITDQLHSFRVNGGRSSEPVESPHHPLHRQECC
jgi:hypothetical protein